MDCISYINDLKVEIETLNELKKGLSDEDKIAKIDEQIKAKQNLIDNCQKNLVKLSDNQLCYRLYVYILSGMSVNKAVDAVAEENYLKGVKPNSRNGIYNYYKKMKKMIE